MNRISIWSIKTAADIFRHYKRYGMVDRLQEVLFTLETDEMESRRMDLDGLGLLTD